jgi:hypothetical protein
VLKEAADASGLHTLFDSEKSPFMAQAPVLATTAADAEWLSWPGRYSVARKCNGTRYLLVIAGDGVAYFYSSSGFVYSYPIVLDCKPGRAQELPPGTVLDGGAAMGSKERVFYRL